MRRLLMMSAAIAMLATAFSASAASLVVDGGVLQSWSSDIDLCEEDPALCPGPQDPEDPEEPEPPATVTITVEARRYNSGRHRNFLDSTTFTFPDVQLGSTYELSWSGGTLSECAEMNENNPEHPFPDGKLLGISGTFTASVSRDHVFCVQTGSGVVTLSPVTPAEATADAAEPSSGATS